MVNILCTWILNLEMKLKPIYYDEHEKKKNHKNFLRMVILESSIIIITTILNVLKILIQLEFKRD